MIRSSLLGGLIGVCLSLALLGGCQRPQGTATLSFEEARVRLPIPGTDKSVGYFAVTNGSDAPVVLTDVRAEGVRAIEFHTMIRDGDVMRMRRLEDVAIGPGETVLFEPGGRHLMMFGVETLPEEVLLTFTDAEGRAYSSAFETFSATN